LQQKLALEALERGDVRAARRAFRVLRTHDFMDAVKADALFGVMRDLRSSDDELAEAIARLAILDPAP
jgi:hypothetical protein